MRRLTPLLIVALAVIAVLAAIPALAASSPAAHATATTIRTEYFHVHIDAYGDYGGCQRGADAQNDDSYCKGTQSIRTEGFLGRAAFNWLHPGLPSLCLPSDITRNLGFTKQMSIHGWEAGAGGINYPEILCGYTKRDLSSAALVIQPQSEIFRHGHQTVHPYTGHNMGDIGGPTGPLHINLITHGHLDREYTLIAYGYLHYAWK